MNIVDFNYIRKCNKKLSHLEYSRKGSIIKVLKQKDRVILDIEGNCSIIGINCLIYSICNGCICVNNLYKLVFWNNLDKNNLYIETV